MAERAAREPVEWGVAAQVPARRGDERGSRGRHACCRTARSWPAIDGLGHGGEAARAAARAADGRAREPEPGPRPAGRALPRGPAGNARGGDQPGLRLAPPSSGMTWLGVGNVEGRVLERRPVGDAARRARSRSARRARARAAGGASRRRSTCGRATSSCWPPTGSRPPSRTRSTSPARRRRSASASWPTTGSRRTTPSWWRSATSGARP